VRKRRVLLAHLPACLKLEPLLRSLALLLLHLITCGCCLLAG
jgi:hypothetical protein